MWATGPSLGILANSSGNLLTNVHSLLSSRVVLNQRPEARKYQSSPSLKSGLAVFFNKTRITYELEEDPNAARADLTIYVIDTAAGQDIPRKRGPGVARSDLLVVNKIDLAPHVGVDRDLLERDTKVARDGRPYVMAALKVGTGVDRVVEFLKREGGL